MVEYGFQAETGNVLNVGQMGASHTAYFSQVGSMSEITLDQIDADHDARIFQGGEGNVANVIRSGEKLTLDMADRWRVRR